MQKGENKSTEGDDPVFLSNVGAYVVSDFMPKGHFTCSFEEAREESRVDWHFFPLFLLGFLQRIEQHWVSLHWKNAPFPCCFFAQHLDGDQRKNQSCFLSCCFQKPPHRPHSAASLPFGGEIRQSAVKHLTWWEDLAPPHIPSSCLNWVDVALLGGCETSRRGVSYFYS